MENTFVYWLDKHLFMKINHCINSNFGRTKHETERENVDVITLLTSHIVQR